MRYTFPAIFDQFLSEVYNNTQFAPGNFEIRQSLSFKYRIIFLGRLAFNYNLVFHKQIETIWNPDLNPFIDDW